MSTTSAARPDDANTASGVTIPLRERPRDWFFVVMFAIFASVSFLYETGNMVGRQDPHSTNPIAHWQGIDPVTMANPRFVQVSVGFISALVFGVFYLVLIFAFARGGEWIRLPAIFYAGMVVMNTIVYLAVDVLGDAPLFALACGNGSSFDYKTPNVLESFAFSVPYILVALLLVARMWRAHPFTRRALGA
jgi:hypothetical protein